METIELKLKHDILAKIRIYSAKEFIMSIYMKGFFLLLSIIMSIVFIPLMIKIWGFLDELNPLFSVFSAFAINLITVPVFSFLNLALELEKKIDDRYFNFIPSYIVDFLNVIFWVKDFRVMVTFQKKNSKQTKFGLRKIYELIRLSKSSEIAHTLPTLVIFPLIIQSLIQGKITMGLFLIIFFIPLHFMPVLLQRKNRIRLKRILSKLKNV
jgi:hypothetical protein